MSIRQGSTVTYVAMQLPIHMGLKEVALVGCDNFFVSKGPAYKTVIAARKIQIILTQIISREL